jgi:hypothetical protein
MAISDKNIRITKNTNTPLGAGNGPKMVFTGAAAGSSVITLEVLDDNSISFSSNEGQIFSLDSNLSEGIIWSVNNISGTPILSASAGSTIGLANFGGLVGIGTVAPQYKLHVQGGSVGIATTNAAVQFLFDNNSASGSNFLDVRFANSIRFFNSTNTFSTALKGGNNPANYTLTLPISLPGAGVSILVSDSTGTMSFPTISGVGISVIGSGTAITFSHSIPLTTYFCSGYTPSSTGADSVVFMVPFSVVDGTSSVNYNIRRVHMRVETPSAGTSTIKLEKYAFASGAGVTVFSNSSRPAVGSTANIMNPLGLSIAGAAIAETFVTSASIGFSTGFATCVSGDKFRVNFTTLNATHANFSISMNLDSVN